MKLKVKCQSCKEDFVLKKSYSTRPYLVDEVGEYFNLQCTNCLKNHEYHANDVIAFSAFQINILSSILGVLIILFVSIFMWNLDYVTNIGLIIGGGIIAASNMSSITSNTNAVNQYKVRRNPKQK